LIKYSFALIVRGDGAASTRLVLTPHMITSIASAARSHAFITYALFESQLLLF
jgi:hypothetical protein